MRPTDRASHERRVEAFTRSGSCGNAPGHMEGRAMSIEIAPARPEDYSDRLADLEWTTNAPVFE